MSRRGVVATSVLAAWAVGLGFLFARELNPSSAARLADVALRVIPITTYYRVEHGGRHVGFASIAIDTVPHSLQVTEYIVTDSVVGGRHSDQLVVRMSRGLSLREFETTTTRDNDSSRVTGAIVDSSLIVSRAGSTQTIPVNLPSFAGIIAPTVAVLLDRPKVGLTSTMRVVDPASGKPSTRTTRIEAESLFVVVDSAVADSSGRWFAVHKDTVRAWRLVTTDTPALDAWMDAQGLVVELRLANGLILKRTAFELAFENWRRAHPERAVSARGDGSVISGTFLASGAPMPTEMFDTLRVRLGASTPRELATRYGRGYRPGSVVRYARMPADRLKARYTLPTTESWRKALGHQLSPAPFIESDDPAIARRAASIIGNDRDPSLIARRIVEWVHDSIRAEVAPQTGAAGAIERKSGDAHEFALLTTALARAAGIPSHPVTGLLHNGGKFYQHSWTEVYVGRWIPVDAMLGQYPADAAHIPFLTGSAEPGPDLARILSRVQLSVIGAVRVQ